MNEEQYKLMVELSEKYGLSEDSKELILLVMGIKYGLSIEQIDTYMTLKQNMVEKHLCMLCEILGMEYIPPEGEDEMDEAMLPDRLDHMLRMHFAPPTIKKKKVKQYKRLMEVIITTEELSAAQIDALLKAAKAGMPEMEILKMLRANKQPQQIEKCVEFYQMQEEIDRAVRRENRKRSILN